MQAPQTAHLIVDGECGHPDLKSQAERGFPPGHNPFKSAQIRQVEEFELELERTGSVGAWPGTVKNFVRWDRPAVMDSKSGWPPLWSPCVKFTCGIQEIYQYTLTMIMSHHPFH